jgi:hypothetical protein
MFYLKTFPFFSFFLVCFMPFNFKGITLLPNKKNSLKFKIIADMERYDKIALRFHGRIHLLST